MRVFERPLRRLEDAAPLLVDDQVGILKYAMEVRKEPGGPNFFHFQGEACNASAFNPQKNFHFTGGASADRGRALAKAIGEGVERYCAAFYHAVELPLSSREEADFACADPASFALFSEAQYESPGFLWVPFTDETPVRWTHAFDAGSGERVFVPAARVFIPYYFPAGSGDSPIDQPISTGLACHLSFAEAALGGICEAVERDAALLAWQAMISPPQIRVETLSDENYDLVQRFEKACGRVRLLNLTTDNGIPAVMAVLTSTSDKAPALVFAPAASLDAETAVRKALEELAHTRRYCQYVMSHAPRIVPDPPEYDSVADQRGHLNFYVDPNNSHLTDFFFSSPKRMDFEEIGSLATGDPEADVEVAVRRIMDTGERVYLRELTTPDVKELGLCVVRAVVPGFQQLHMGFRNRCLGGRRLWEVPQKLGYRGISPASGDYPAPHPYP